MAIYSHDVAYDFSSVTPDNNTDLPPNRGLWVAVEGDVWIRNRAGESVFLGTLPPGTVVPGHIRRVLATTTATVVRMK
jgi:hypothetical protein